MRKITILLFLLTLGSLGCGQKTPAVVVTSETEAEQMRAEQDVRNAEAAYRKTQKPAKSFEQSVEDEESNRRRR
ncbi:MAG: hypothetical protein KF873_14345 [Gemmataceae bacterium]|nr:hypothetical protein [Gemmataceae bacterium]